MPRASTKKGTGTSSQSAMEDNGEPQSATRILLGGLVASLYFASRSGRLVRLHKQTLGVCDLPQMHCWT